MGVHMLKKEGGPVFQTREEAEEADHVRWEKTEGGLDIIARANFFAYFRYNEKQARIAERRRLNYEKKLAVCQLWNLIKD